MLRSIFRRARKWMHYGAWLLTTISVSAMAESITIQDVEIEYEIKGEGIIPVVFEAGALSGMEGWNAIWNKLPEGVTAVRYSRRGEGGSGPCEGNLSARDYADDLNRLVTSLNLPKPFVFVAHSYGGKIARVYAAVYPDDVAGMLMLDPSNPADIEIVKALDPINGAQEIETIKAADFAAGKGQWCFLQDLWKKDPMPGFSQIGDKPVTLIAGIKPVPDSPMLFLSAIGRQKWGEAQQAWVDQFPQGRVVLSKQSGHFVQDDEPQRVLDELIILLNRLPTRQ